MNLTKSKYCLFWQCPKQLWLRQYKPEEQIINASTEARFKSGNEVGDLAMQFLGDYVEVSSYKDDGRLDIASMIDTTKDEMEKGTENICEAAFSYDGLYCAVDILHRNGNKWDIYEVKSSTDPYSDVYYADVAYQKYVLGKCGIKVNKAFLVCINNQYVRDGEIDIQQLFIATDISDEVENEYVNVEMNIRKAERILANQNEPDIDISLVCRNPYECGFWNYCTKDVPEQSVFNLYRMPFEKKIGYYRNGQITFEDLINDPSITNEKQLRQMEYALSDKGTYVEPDNIRVFLGKLSYPLYFLDFETIQPIIPLYDGTRPYQQIPFQYSLHYIESEGGELKHKEFLAESGPDPRRKLAESLCKDIPMNVCTTAYNKAFECTRIKEMADAFPDLSEHLLNIADNIVDLLVPFQSGYYYKKAMGGSFSIKSVLPAIFPDDPSLDYHNLEGVHNGGEAMTIFPLIKDMSPEERETTRRNLLKYCELDTYAMVKVWMELLKWS